MKNKKGFTLVELLVVIVLIGLLVVIAVPSGLTISKKVKQKMLDTKIEQIESAAIIWGQQNKSEIKDPDRACSRSYTGATACVKKTIGELLNDENALEGDDTITLAGKEVKVLKNPTNDAQIYDNCYVEIYIKNKRVYAEYYYAPSNINTCYYTN